MDVEAICGTIADGNQRGHADPVLDTCQNGILRIGRLLVASVQATDVVLRMNDFGTVREQTYSLRKTEDAP